MDPYKETFETWNKIASLYEEKFMHLDLYNDSYNYFLKEIPIQEASILDVGCGPGNISKYLLQLNPQLKILGIDVSPNMLALAQQNNPTANFKTMDCRDINLLKTTFDGIVCGFCLPYLSSKDSFKLFKDCSNLLNNEGILYISFVEGEYLQSGYKTISTGDRSYFYYHQLDNINTQLKEHNFKVVKLLHVKYQANTSGEEIHTIIIAKKV